MCLGVVLGAIGVAAGWQQADPVIELIIAVAILTVLRSEVRQVGARLMDAVDTGLVTQARAAVAFVDGVRSVDELGIRWLGHQLRAEVAVTVESAAPAPTPAATSTPSSPRSSPSGA
jgi:divalent metal cation (Fe/Co/Zn/Cd) transporter